MGSVTAKVTNLTDPAGTVRATGSSKKAQLSFAAFPIFAGDVRLSVPTFDKVRYVRAFAAGAPLLGATALRYERVEDGEEKITVTDTIRFPPNEGSFSLIFAAN